MRTNRAELPVATRAEAEAETPRLRRPRAEDGPAVHGLVRRCPPLDVNSRYAYLLLCEHFAATSILAENGAGEIVGYISAYLKPDDPATVFVWQVAVDERMRGRRLGSAMLGAIMKAEAVGGARYLETTVSPSNEASLRLFGRFAREQGAELRTDVLFGEALFGAKGHEREDLIRIGPLAGRCGEQGK